MRHSCSHVMAQAVMEMFPEAKLAVGPWIDGGFYHDFELPRTLIPEDLPILEKKMKQIMKQRQKFRRYELPSSEAIKFLKKRHQDYTAEMGEDLKKAGEKTLSFYENIIPQNGKVTFVNMCAGPHTENTGKIGAFKLTKIAGAYFKGDSNRPMLQRIYGACYETQKELDDYLKMMEEQEKRDHRKLGKELELYIMSDEVGAGLPLWLPNGAILAEEIEKLGKEVEFEAGYSRVRTPHITKGSLYRKSGHLPYYKDSMYPPMSLDNDEEYYLKPMNCPHHHIIYGSKPRSYRDLPLRLAEYGHCYRFEDSGALFGLMRVRSMCMNDAHIYCTLEQFESEFLAVLDIYKKYFDLFGIGKYEMRLSLHDKEGLGKKYVDNEKLWIETEALVRKAMKKSKVNFVEVPGEAAFYGPKIDVEIWSAIGREFTLATNQLDFAVPARFDLKYTDADGKEKTPLCIHRAPLSTHERLIGFLIEHFAGAFPVWLAPEQVRLMPVAEPHVKYAEEFLEELRKNKVRVTLAGSEESLGKRIRNAEKMKIPYMLVIGDEEVKGGSVAVRDYKTNTARAEGLRGEIRREATIKSQKKDAFVKKLLKEIESRSL